MSVTYDEIIQGIKSNPNNTHGIWVNEADEIMCKTELQAETIADFLETTNIVDVAQTGFYDPNDDERNQETDECSGLYYVKTD